MRRNVSAFIFLGGNLYLFERGGLGLKVSDGLYASEY